MCLVPTNFFVKGRDMESLFVSKNITPLITCICGGLAWIMAVYFMYLKKKTQPNPNNTKQVVAIHNELDDLGDKIAVLIEKSMIVICGVCIIVIGFYVKIKGYFTPDVGLYGVLSLLFLCALWLLADGKISLPEDKE